MGLTGIDIADYLKEWRTSEDNAINARDLCTMFNLTSRHLRIIVGGLRKDGVPICSSTQGYWYSTEPEDIKKTLQRLEGQVSNMNNSITGLKKVLTGGENES